MSYKHICDRCNQEIKDNFVRIEYAEGSNRIIKDFHIDCFNYEFSCDIRKMQKDLFKINLKYGENSPK